MRKTITTTEVGCDICTGTSRDDAEVRCEVHALDLCIYHMRNHFKRDKCLLVPVEREPTDWELQKEKMDKLSEISKDNLRRLQEKPPDL